MCSENGLLELVILEVEKVERFQVDEDKVQGVTVVEVGGQAALAL